MVSTAEPTLPKVRRQSLPPALLRHLLDRIQRRNVSADQLGLMADWLDLEPDVPEGKWYKHFPDMTVCGEGEWIKTFLMPGQVADGQELQ